MPPSQHDRFHLPPPFPPSSDRSFGRVFAVVFLLIGGWPLWHGEPVRWWALGLSGAFLLASQIAPGILRPLNILWAHAGRVLNKITTPIFTSGLFFLLFTPVGVLRRLLGKDALRLKPAAGGSYWIERRPPGPEPESLRHQF